VSFFYYKWSSQFIYSASFPVKNQGKYIHDSVKQIVLISFILLF